MRCQGRQRRITMILIAGCKRPMDPRPIHKEQRALKEYRSDGGSSSGSASLSSGNTYICPSVRGCSAHHHKRDPNKNNGQVTKKKTAYYYTVCTTGHSSTVRVRADCEMIKNEYKFPCEEEGVCILQRPISSKRSPGIARCTLDGIALDRYILEAQWGIFSCHHHYYYAANAKPQHHFFNFVYHLHPSCWVIQRRHAHTHSQ